MKTAEEYIEDLDHNAAGHTCMLLVGFEENILPIAGPNRLRLLQEAMETGGIPFAFARMKPGKLEMGLLPEYEGDEHLQGVLDRYRELIAIGIQKAS